MVGTSLGVYPAAGIVPLAARRGSAIVIVNAEPTPFDDIAAVVLRAPISDVLPALVDPTPVAPASGARPTGSTDQTFG